MKEWQRTVILIALLGAAIYYLTWAHYAIDTSLVVRPAILTRHANT